MAYASNANDVICFSTMHVASVAATTGYMLVDLSDTINWKHFETGHIDLVFVNIMINPGGSFSGSVDLGFLSNVDATNGDLNVIRYWPLDSESTPGQSVYELIQFGGIDKWFHCGTERAFLTTHANSTLFQTDVNLEGPDGNTAYPSGNGDLVLRVVRTAGAISFGVLVGYVTRP